MTIFTLMAGVMIAAFLFASLLWSVHGAFTIAGKARISYICLSIFILLAMAVVSLDLPIVSRLTALPLIASAIAVGVASTGWSRMLVLPPLAFAAILIAGLPFSAT